MRVRLRKHWGEAQVFRDVRAAATGRGPETGVAGQTGLAGQRELAGQGGLGDGGEILGEVAEGGAGRVFRPPGRGGACADKGGDKVWGRAVGGLRFLGSNGDGGVVEWETNFEMECVR